ncbi:hypothetical protein HY213_02230 [Candidatus Peregrinibacteria bacterium]|nr:hypothetical protein [Candidatus Peregrinibacteria bacterium]
MHDDALPDFEEPEDFDPAEDEPDDAEPEEFEPFDPEEALEEPPLTLLELPPETQSKHWGGLLTFSTHWEPGSCTWQNA